MQKKRESKLTFADMVAFEIESFIREKSGAAMVKKWQFLMDVHNTSAATEITFEDWTIGGPVFVSKQGIIE